MTDYLTQCNSLAAEKKVWRWAKFTYNRGNMVHLYREDFVWFHKTQSEWSRTEYDGDEYGNPIPAVLGPQELWDKYKIIIEPSMTTWTVYRTSIEHGLEIISAPQPTYDEALAEANHIAGGGA